MMLFMCSRASRATPSTTSITRSAKDYLKVPLITVCQGYFPFSMNIRSVALVAIDPPIE